MMMPTPHHHRTSTHPILIPRSLVHLLSFQRLQAPKQWENLNAENVCCVLCVVWCNIWYVICYQWYVWCVFCTGLWCVMCDMWCPVICDVWCVMCCGVCCGVVGCVLYITHPSHPPQPLVYCRLCRIHRYMIVNWWLRRRREWKNVWHPWWGRDDVLTLVMRYVIWCDVWWCDVMWFDVWCDVVMWCGDVMWWWGWYLIECVVLYSVDMAEYFFPHSQEYVLWRHHRNFWFFSLSLLLFSSFFFFLFPLRKNDLTFHFFPNSNHSHHRGYVHFLSPFLPSSLPHLTHHRHLST